MTRGNKAESVVGIMPDEESGLVILKFGEDPPFGVDPQDARNMARLLVLAAYTLEKMLAKRAAQPAQPAAPSAAAMKMN